VAGVLDGTVAAPDGLGLGVELLHADATIDAMIRKARSRVPRGHRSTGVSLDCDRGSIAQSL
jgi:hypothetical protein